MLFMVNITQAPALAAPPYNWSPSNVGLSNFAMAVDGVIGLFASGPFSDWVAMRATVGNGYVREPEMRLPATIPFIILGAVAMIVCGVGFDHHWPWQAVLIIGFGCTGIVSVGLPTVAVTYAIDSYRPVGNYVLVTATVFKNSFAFSMTYYINNWAAEKGIFASYMMVLALGVGIPAIGLVIFYV